MRLLSLWILTALIACDPPDTTTPLPPGVPGDALVGAAPGPGGPEGAGPAGSDAGQSTPRAAPAWTQKGSAPLTTTLTLSGGVTGSCCTGGDEVEGAPLRFFMSPAAAGQRDGYVIVLGKGDKVAVLQQEDRNKYSKELYRGTAAVVAQGGIATLEVPVSSLPAIALKIWPGSPGNVTIAGVAVEQTAEGGGIPFVVVLPPGTTEPKDLGAPVDPAAGGDPNKEPPAGEPVGAFEKSPPQVAGDPKTAPPPGATAGETPKAGGESPTPPPDPKNK